jgi:pimeloyl-ACP methyl ester carboxylesterase
MPLVPTLYLHGAQDGCLDRRFYDLAAARLTDPHRAVLVEGAGHFMTVEQPAYVAEQILDFLS